MTSCPASTARAAATAESTPPDMAARTRIDSAGPASTGRSPRRRRPPGPARRPGRSPSTSASTSARGAGVPEREPQRAARAARRRSPSRAARGEGWATPAEQAEPVEQSMPRASSSISSESPSQPGKVRCALPGSRSAGSGSPLSARVGDLRLDPARPGRRAARRPGRACSGWRLTASSTARGEAGDGRGVDGAGADVALLAAAVQQRGDAPARGARRARRRRTGRRACARSAVSASTPLAAKSTGTWPTACTASVCTGMSCSCGELRRPRRPAGRCRPRCWPTSPRPGRPTPGRARARRAGRPTSRRPSRSTGSSSTSAPSCSASQCSGSRTAWCSTAVDEDPGAPRVLRAAGPEEPLDREVVRLGAAGGEHHLAGPAAERRGDALAGLLHHPARGPAGGVQRGRVAGRGAAARSSPRRPRRTSGVVAAWSR